LILSCGIKNIPRSFWPEDKKLSMAEARKELKSSTRLAS
jgi:hypothetical protein